MPEYEFRRASGDCICGYCGKTYNKHPLFEDDKSAIDGEPFLNRLCDGTLVKL